MFLPLEPSTWSAGLRANLQWKPEASLGLACVFLSFFKLGYRVTFMCWVSNCIKSKESNESQVPRVIRFKSNVNACLAKCSVFLCGAGALRARPRALLAAGRKCCWNKTRRSALWNKHTQGSTVLLPAAASNLLHAELFPFAVTSLKWWHVILHCVHQTSLISATKLLTHDTKARGYKLVW